jgi:hypothetical protein
MPVLLEHARLALPVMVIGIEPGAARTTSPTLRQCDLEVAELTSLLTTVSLSAIFSRYAPRFLSSIMRQAAPCLRANRNYGAPTSPGSSPPFRRENAQPVQIKGSVMPPMTNSSASK